MYNHSSSYSSASAVTASSACTIHFLKDTYYMSTHPTEKLYQGITYDYRRKSSITKDYVCTAFMLHKVFMCDSPLTRNKTSHTGKTWKKENFHFGWVGKKRS